jgi:hypothetical protein
MTRKQIVICFENQKWICDFIQIEEGQNQQEVIDIYMKEYEKIRNSMEIVKLLLPAIIHISVM